MIVKYGEEVINDYEEFGDVNDVFEGDWEQELQYNISMMKVKSYKVVGVEDTNINFDVCKELYEMWCGLDLGGRVVEVSFWKEQISDFIDEVKDDGDYDSKDEWTIKVEEVLKEVSKLEEGLYIQFQELLYNISMMNYKSVCEKFGDEVGLKVLDFIEEGWGENGADEFKFDDGSVFAEVVEEFVKEL